MDSINKLYSELKGLDSIAKMYFDGKKEIQFLENEIVRLKNERNSIEMDDLISKIEKMEIELNAVNKEVECQKILGSACLSMKDLKSVLKNITDQDTCQEKCLDFIKSSVIPFTITADSYRKLFKVEKDEKFYTVLKIAKELEEMLSLVSSKAYFKETIQYIKSVFAEELPEVVPFDVDLYSSEESIFIVFPCHSPDNFDDLPKQQLTFESFDTLITTFPNTFDCVLAVLKMNLSKSIIKDRYALVDVIENNKKFINTKYYIVDEEEWMIDIYVKTALSLSKNEPDEQHMILSDSSVTGKYISSYYSQYATILQLIDKSESLRKDKAKSMVLKSLKKYFSGSMDNFLIFSDITHFTKTYTDDEEFSKLREEIFYSIMKSNTNINIDLSENILMSKAKIKQLQFDFDEKCECFVSPKSKSFFKISFFDKLFENFYNFVVKNYKIENDEKEAIKELSAYLLDISYEVSHENISNISKIICLNKIIGLSIETVIDFYESNEFDIPKNDLRSLIRVLFNKSALRDGFIDQLL